MKTVNRISSSFSGKTHRGSVDERLVLILGLVGIALLLAGVIAALDRSIESWTIHDLDRRALLLARLVAHDVDLTSSDEVRQHFESLSRDDRLIGLIACFADRPMVSNRALSGLLSCNSPLARYARANPGRPVTDFIGPYEVRVSAYHFGANGRNALLIVQDRAFIQARRRSVLQGGLIGSGIALLVLVLLLYYGLRATRHRIGRSLREIFHTGSRRTVPRELRPLLRDLDESVRKARASMEAAGLLTGPERLRQLVKERMPDTPLVLVANREPYIHTRDGDRIRVDRPASGLVTGVEPLLRACGGVWIGTGSGSADRETSDAAGRLAVPPEDPEYLLRRIWLTPRELEGYYYGFANEGLWPLCHMAHTRPTFREEDWKIYRSVNRRFAEAAVEEAGPHGLILAQDYHYGVLPMEVRKLAPESVISLFWHIPWPNDEVFGILPWKEELLDGMLGADVIGFHTRYHCLNFLDTVQRYLECRVDLDQMAVEYQQRKTAVRPYPISVEWPHASVTREEGDALRHKLGIPEGVHIAIGVDRADYTKGLIERVAAVELLLTEHPELVGRFVFVQLAAPSRTHIRTYRMFISELEDAVTRVNRKFGGEGYLPIIFELQSYSPEEVRQHYGMADFALVTPLHDGMNLVAKEYVASIPEGTGALILSIFAGAAKELEGALLVNPYDAGEVANAILRAIEMPDEERRARMAAMKAAIEKNTIFDWSANLLSDMAEIWEKRNTAWRVEERVQV